MDKIESRRSAQLCTPVWFTIDSKGHQQARVEGVSYGCVHERTCQCRPDHRTAAWRRIVFCFAQCCPPAVTVANPSVARLPPAVDQRLPVGFHRPEKRCCCRLTTNLCQCMPALAHGRQTSCTRFKAGHPRVWIQRSNLCESNTRHRSLLASTRVAYAAQPQTGLK